MTLSNKIKKMFRNIAIGSAILGSSLVLNSDINIKQSYYDKAFSKNPGVEKKVETYEEKIKKIENLLDEIPMEGKDYYEENLYNSLDTLAIVARENIMNFYKIYNNELENARKAKEKYDYFKNYKLVNNYGLDKFLENTYYLADFHQYTKDALKRIDLKIEELSLFEGYHRDKLSTLILVYGVVQNKNLLKEEFKKQNAIIEYYSLLKESLGNLKREILDKSSELLREF
ncbi:MAG: hypothetical protein QXR30_04370 [Candidatus Woesearchaeota archaeon]